MKLDVNPTQAFVFSSVITFLIACLLAATKLDIAPGVAFIFFFATCLSSYFFRQSGLAGKRRSAVVITRVFFECVVSGFLYALVAFLGFGLIGGTGMMGFAVLSAAFSVVLMIAVVIFLAVVVAFYMRGSIRTIFEVDAMQEKEMLWCFSIFSMFYLPGFSYLVKLTGDPFFIAKPFLTFFLPGIVFYAAIFSILKFVNINTANDVWLTRGKNAPTP